MVGRSVMKALCPIVTTRWNDTSRVEPGSNERVFGSDATR